MTRQRVSSSNIASIGYDAVQSVLEVEFLNGAVYRYYGVPEVVFNGLMAADSHGKYSMPILKGALSIRKGILRRKTIFVEKHAIDGCHLSQHMGDIVTF